MDAVDPELVDTIERQARAVPGVIDVSWIRVRWIGHRLEASLHAVVDCTLSVAEGHQLAENVRHAADHDVKKLDAILVDIDPCDHVNADHHETTRGHDPAPPPYVPIGYGGPPRVRLTLSRSSKVTEARPTQGRASGYSPRRVRRAVASRRGAAAARGGPSSG